MMHPCPPAASPNITGRTRDTLWIPRGADSHKPQPGHKGDGHTHTNDLISPDTQPSQPHTSRQALSVTHRGESHYKPSGGNTHMHISMATSI